MKKSKLKVKLPKAKKGKANRQAKLEDQGKR